MTVELHRPTLERLVGERTVPQLWHENYWFRRHEIAYLALDDRVLSALATPDEPEATAPGARHATNSTGVVLEAGCGEGYGIPLLRAAGVDRIVGLDYDAETVRHVADSYAAPVGRTNLAALPLADQSVAAIVCFQVIEHLWTPWEFVGECARVLRPGGVLLVSTPNRLTFSPGLLRGERPANPFHVKEFDQQELVDTIHPQLPVTQVLGIDHGPRLRAWEAANGPLMAAQLASSPSDWPEDLVDLVGSVRAGDFELVPSSPTVHDLVVVARKEAG